MEMASNTGRTKSLISSLSQTSILRRNLLDLGCDTINENELGNTVARTDHKRLVDVQVLQDHLDLARIVGIDDARQRVQTVLHGQSRSRTNLSISSWREIDGDTGRDDHAPAREYDVIVNAEKVIPNGTWGCARRQNCIRYQLGDIECHCSL